MTRIIVEDMDIAKEIAEYVFAETHVEMTPTQVLGYMKDPTNYVPDEELVKETYLKRRADNPIYTEDRARDLLRQPFTMSRREYFAEKVLKRRRRKPSPGITREDIIEILDSAKLDPPAAD